MKHQELIRKLKGIIEKSENPEEFSGLVGYLDKCFSPDTPSHEIRIMGLTEEFINRYHSVKPEDRVAYDSLRKEAQALLEGMGYRANTLTSQEHELMGSSGYTYKDKPYKPVGLIKGEITLEEAKKARELERIAGAFSWFYDIHDLPKDFSGITISLEPLDKNGNTIRDPQPLDKNLNPVPDYKKTKKFPFPRD